MNKSIIKYALITSIRDSLYFGIFIVILFAIGVSYFLGSTAIVEQHEMIISFVASSSRALIQIGLILFVIFHIKRMFVNREIDFIISQPVSRKQFIFSYWVALTIISMLIIIPVVFVVGCMQHINVIGLFYWAISIFFESIMVVAFSLLVSLCIESGIVAILSAFCFYVVSRMIGFFVASDAHNVVPVGGLFQNILHYLLQFMSVIVPRLDLFCNSEWIIYGDIKTKDILIYMTQSAVYIPLLLLVSFIDISKKDF